MAEASRDLTRKAWTGLAQLLVLLASLLFLSAWSLRFWRAWAFWLVFSVCVFLITRYFLERDPSLIERRLKAGPAAETERSQKIIQLLASVFFVAEIVVPGLDHRAHWSEVPAALVIASDFLVAIGFAIVFLAFKENSFASAVIEVNQSQSVISTGPYQIVRHPMYAGALLMLVAAPLALGSFRTLLLVPFTIFVIVWRLLDEEKYLARHLPGYEEYRRKTRYRLLPFVW